MVRAVTLTVAVVVGLGVVVIACQSSLLYPGTELPRPALDPETVGFEEVQLLTEEGPGIAWFLPPTQPTEAAFPVAMFFHGNYETIDAAIPRLRRLRAAGIGVMAVEYPGYGGAPGEPSQESITAVAIAAYDAVVRDPRVDATRVFAWGFSLGGGPAAQLAARRPLAALLLQSTFTSVRDMAGEFGLPGFLVSDPFDTAAVVTGFDGPVLVLHGDRDEVIPYAHGVQLGSLGAHVEFHRMQCGHNDCPGDFKGYWERVFTFLSDARIAH